MPILDIQEVRAMNDVELEALAALVKGQAVLMDGANQLRAMTGYTPAYTNEVHWPECDVLRAELIRRKVLPE